MFSEVALISYVRMRISSVQCPTGKHDSQYHDHDTRQINFFASVFMKFGCRLRKVVV